MQAYEAVYKNRNKDQEGKIVIVVAGSLRKSAIKADKEIREKPYILISVTLRDDIVV